MRVKWKWWLVVLCGGGSVKGPRGGGAWGLHHAPRGPSVGPRGQETLRPRAADLTTPLTIERPRSRISLGPLVLAHHMNLIIVGVVARKKRWSSPSFQPKGVLTDSQSSMAWKTRSAALSPSISPAS